MKPNEMNHVLLTMYMYVSDIRIHRTSSLTVPKTFIYIY